MRFVALRVLYGVIAGLSLGALTGAGELTYLTWFQLKLLMTPAQWSGLFGMAVLTYGLVGAGVGAVASAALAPLLGRGTKVQYYRSVMKRDLLASALAPVVGVVGRTGVVVRCSPELAGLRHGRSAAPVGRGRTQCGGSAWPSRSSGKAVEFAWPRRSGLVGRQGEGMTTWS